MNKAQNSPWIVALAATCLSILSIYTTAKGFNIYLPIPWLGWIVSAAVQILIVWIVFKRFRPWAYIITVPTYLGLLLFSVGGSFLLIDEQLSLQDRRVQTASDTCMQASSYLDKSSAYVRARLDLIQVLITRLKAFQEEENGGGVLSKAGPGQGPMYKEISVRFEVLSATQKNLSANTNDLESRCRTSPTLTDFNNRPDATGALCETKIACGAEILASLPPDHALERLLKQTSDLFKLNGKIETMTPEMPPSDRPDRPDVKVGVSTLQQRLEGAKNDLILNRRFSTWLSLVLALTLDVLLLLIAVISRLQSSPSDQESRTGDVAYILNKMRSRS
jgi:hypothetical protein